MGVVNLIKIKERNEKDIMIRCNTVQEKQFVIYLFLDLKQNGRMQDKISVKDIRGYEMVLPKQQEIPPQPEKMQEPISDDNYMGRDEHMNALLNKKDGEEQINI